MTKLFKNRILLLLGIYMLGACSSSDVPQGIPEFSMVMPDTTQVFHSRDIPEGKPVVLIQFDPNCKDCQIETENILANMAKYRNINFYLVTRHTYKEMMVFHDHLKLDTCTNLKIGIDTTGAIAKAYQYRSTPLTLIYNTKKELTAVIRGGGNPEQMDSLFIHSQTQL